MGQLFDEYPALLVLPEILLGIVLLLAIIWYMRSPGKRGTRRDDEDEAGRREPRD